jgi:hypothetical protein
MAVFLLASCAAPPAPVPIPDRAFPAPFREATDWMSVELVVPEAHPLAGGFTDLDLLIATLTDFVAVGRADLGDDAITTEISSGIERGGSGELFVQVVGGLNAAHAGDQYRIAIRREDGVWVVDSEMLARRFCRESLGGPRGQSCR